MKVLTILKGGLGNNLFQISAAISYSMKHKIDYCIPCGIQNPHYEGQKVFWSPYINYCAHEICTAHLYREPCFEYAEIPPPDGKNVLLDGYFQSSKFIEPYKEEVLEILDIPYTMKKQYVGIHWRLGDFRNIPNCHPPVSIRYINQAIEYFINRGYKKFIVCSDEIDFAYDHIKRPDNCHFEFSEGRTEIEDLILLSSCEHLLGSNSSYSWWAFYLNQNEDKLGIFPRTWFGKDLQHSTKDLYMPEMILL